MGQERRHQEQAQQTDENARELERLRRENERLRGSESRDGSQLREDLRESRTEKLAYFPSCLYENNFRASRVSHSKLSKSCKFHNLLRFCGMV